MKKERPDVNRVILLSIFVISISLFTYQITLTRLYSAILSYHYVFLTTSFAILGVGLGSILAYRDRARLSRIVGADHMQPRKVMMQVNKWAFALSCGFIGVFVLVYVQPFIDSLVIYSVLGIIPFVVSGYLFSMLFKLWPWVSGKMYFADLLGAGVGSVAIIAILDNFGMFKAAVLICLLPLIVAAILPTANKRFKAVQCAMPVILVVGLFLPVRMTNAIETNFYAMLNNTGKTFGEMQRTGLAPEIVFSRWDSFARTDLIRIPDIPQLKILTIDGSANAPMYVFDGDAENLDHFKANTGFIPFAMAQSDSALIIGAGGGRGVLYALAAGSSNIAAIEINPASIEAARMFGDFNGHLFNRPEVRTYIQDGRNFARTTDEQFDIIFLSLVVTNTTQGVGLALSEN
ncbi:MAG: methyltransferase domain-containing protein, partial [Oscillospiraceae bacterium]|nr:methyltransferase domain-containing protein [Oscillospiraceae bacterium]